MPTILMVKSLTALHPTDDAGRAALRSLGQGEVVSVEFKRPRNVQFHRKFFAMLGIILANQEHYQSIDDLLDVCKLAIGHYRTIETQDGLVKIPNSISFAAMDDAAFNVFYGKAVDWVCTTVIPGLERGLLDEDVRNELINFGERP